MEENLKYMVKINAFYGYRLMVDESMGFIKCPTLNDLKENMLYYVFLVNHFIGLYEDNKNNFYEIIFSDEHFKDFITLISFFCEIKDIKLENDRLFINEINFFDKNNVSLFMEVLRILHHFDKKDDDYKPANKIAAEMMERARKLKKEMESKIKNKDGIGFLEISSTVCGRHQSINPSNIGQLNYYQIIDQYKRLMMIDVYTPCLYGNATEEYIKKNKVKHYSSKITNE